MGITIKEIARLAGVSRGTVDRALNNRGQVAPEVKEKILKIARDFNYKKNVLASRLAINSNIKVSVILPSGKEDIFWEGPLKGIEKMQTSLADFGMTMDFQFFNLFDKESYSRAFQKAIYGRPDAILIAPIFLKETLANAQLAKQNGIPIVCVNSEIESNDFLSFIGQDSFQSGVIAGKLFDLRSSTRNEIIVITQGHDAKNASHIIKKIDGLKQYNRENDCGFEIISIQIKDFQQPEMLQSNVDEILEAYKNLRGIFFTNSRAYHFIQNTNISDRINKETTVVGYDLIRENVELLREGKIDFLLNQKPEMQGYFGILTLSNHLIHKKNVLQRQYLPIDIVVKENMDSYLDERERFLDFVE